MEEDDYNGGDQYAYGAEEEDVGEEAVGGEEDVGLGLPGQQDPGTSGHGPGGQQQQQQQHIKHEHEDRSQMMQKRLMDSVKEAGKWRAAFKEVAEVMGYSGAREPDVQSVVEAVQRMKQQAQTMQNEMRELHRREAALQIALADRSFEAAELRRDVAAGWAASEPGLLQLRQLLLDPAVNREFVRMRTELDEAHKELSKVKEELAVAHFTQDSKLGRQLLAKCRSLADENEQMASELAEGKVQQLEAQVQLQRVQADELLGQVADLLEHCTLLNEETEALQRECFALRRKVKDYELEGPPDFQGRVMHHDALGGRGYRGARGGGRGPFRGGGRGGGGPGGPLGAAPGVVPGGGMAMGVGVGVGGPAPGALPGPHGGPLMGMSMGPPPGAMGVGGATHLMRGPGAPGGGGPMGVGGPGVPGTMGPPGNMMMMGGPPANMMMMAPGMQGPPR